MTSSDLSDFTYELPDERIAKFPLKERDQSRLLVYQQGKITHARFENLVQYLPADSNLFFNDTKVIPARIRFTKESGAMIELFLLTPLQPSASVAETMAARNQCTWECAIGNLKRWKSTALVTVLATTKLVATLIDREKRIVTFSWDTNATFAEILEQVGVTPLPPYLHREPVEEDKLRYQTVYSASEGAVAAPTAGLHFTERIFQQLRSQKMNIHFLTLHVSAGTFMPVKTTNILEHRMHEEQIVITRQNIIDLLSGKRIIAVGTTSMRTLESLYWFGVKLITQKTEEFSITQDDPYVMNQSITAQESLERILKFMESLNLPSLTGHTSIFIRPGYEFKICSGLITNFHQPASTLIMLVAAFVGSDWNRIYEEALKNDYRFLSYGDSSLLLP